jgi:glycosyltransferase involved in cell wall biosynthesis
MRPVVSCLMPAYNAERFIGQAIQSILDQSFENFELLIWNDGSQDATLDIINSFSDERIKVFSGSNLGLTNTLNNLLVHALGKFICRMDADDISQPDRFHKQVSFLEVNKNTVLVGSGVKLFVDDINKSIKQDIILRNNEILKKICYFGFPVSHPSIMFRRLIIDLGVKYQYPCGEENKFFYDCSRFGSIENMNYYGLNYRLSNHSHSGNKNAWLHEEYWYKTQKEIYNSEEYVKSHILGFYFNYIPKFLLPLVWKLKSHSRTLLRRALISEINEKFSIHHKVLGVCLFPLIALIRKK